MKYLFLILFFLSASVFSSDSKLGGTVSNITSIREGLLILLDTGKPSGCTQGTGWMIIKKEHSTMISVALASYMAGNKTATIYVDVSSSGSYCEIVQYDPA
ncbi:hypothetical protein ACU6U9_01755 [Pseudomonas sp. HK3]